MELIALATSKTLLDAVAASIGNSTAVALPVQAAQLTWQTSFGSAPASITIQLQTSNDNSIWSTIDTSTSTAGETLTISTSALFVRVRINAASGGSGVTVTLVAKAGLIGSSAPGLPVNSLQYNSGGVFSGDANLTWNGTTLTANGLFSQIVSTTTRVSHHVENDAPDSASNLNIVGYDSYIATNSSNANNHVSIKGADLVAEHDGSGTLTFLCGMDGDGESYSSSLVSTIIGVRGLADNNSTGGATWLTGLRGIFGNDGGGSTVADASGLDVKEQGGSGTITRNYGVYVPALAQGITNYGYYSGMSAAAGNWAFYGAGTAASHFGGDLDSSGDIKAATFHVGAAAGIDASITTAGLVGKTITVSKGIITGFA